MLITSTAAMSKPRFRLVSILSLLQVRCEEKSASSCGLRVRLRDANVKPMAGKKPAIGLIPAR